MANKDDEDPKVTQGRGNKRADKLPWFVRLSDGRDPISEANPLPVDLNVTITEATILSGSETGLLVGGDPLSSVHSISKRRSVYS